MGRAAVRTAVTAFLENAASPSAAYIPYVGTVYSARPLIVDETAYENTMSGQAVTSSGTGGNAILVVNLDQDVRKRKADTGRGAVNDEWTHGVFIEIFYANLGGNDTQPQGLAAQGDYDLIVDAITNAIRSDATLGDPSVIWSAGEYEDIVHAQNAPKTSEDGTTVYIVGTLRFTAWEWVNGTVTPPA